jgi:hypothetical protein
MPDDTSLSEILAVLERIDTKLGYVLQNQNNFPIQELLNPNGQLLSAINGLTAAVENFKK